jgi:phage terminase Nu1 subunit (DNA packaging protein)
MSGELRRVQTTERLVDRDALAKIFDVSTDTIDAMRRDGMPAIRWGRRLVRFSPSDCRRWLESQEDEAA